MARNRRTTVQRSVLVPLSAVAGARPSKTRQKRWDEAWARVPHALIDDARLSADAKTLMIYRLSRTNSWVLHWRDVQKRFGWSKTRFYAALAALIDTGYLARTQLRPSGGRWGRAQEAVNRGAMGVEGREGFQQLPRLIIDDRRLGDRDLLSLAAMKSHAPGRPFYPRDLAQILRCHSQTALKALRSLMRLGLVVRKVVRCKAGKFGGSTYQLAEHSARGIAVNHQVKSRETDLRATANEDTYKRLPGTEEHKKRRNYAFRGAKDAADREVLVDLTWLDELPEKYQQEFNLHSSSQDIPETYDEISDAELLERLKDATNNRVHEKLKTPEGLGTIRFFMTAGVDLEDIFDVIYRRVGRKPGKFLNGWGVIAIPIATEILVPGFNTRGRGKDDLD